MRQHGNGFLEDVIASFFREKFEETLFEGIVHQFTDIDNFDTQFRNFAKTIRNNAENLGKRWFANGHISMR